MLRANMCFGRRMPFSMPCADRDIQPLDGDLSFTRTVAVRKKP